MPSPVIYQPLKCDHCGVPLVNGYQERSLGMDVETGYHDVEILCGDCAAGARMIGIDDGDGDRSVTATVKLCDKCGEVEVEIDQALCEDCDYDEARYEAADLAYDLSVEDDEDA